jgi:hypothetical protein
MERDRPIMQLNGTAAIKHAYDTNLSGTTRARTQRNRNSRNPIYQEHERKVCWRKDATEETRLRLLSSQVSPALVRPRKIKNRKLTREPIQKMIHVV